MDRLPNKDKKDYDFPPVKQLGFLERNSAVLVALVGLILFIVVAKYEVSVHVGLSKASSIALRWLIATITLFAGTVQALYWFNNQDEHKSLRAWFHDLYEYSNLKFSITLLCIISYVVVAISFIIFVVNL